MDGGLRRGLHGPDEEVVGVPWKRISCSILEDISSATSYRCNLIWRSARLML